MDKRYNELDDEETMCLLFLACDTTYRGDSTPLIAHRPSQVYTLYISRCALIGCIGAQSAGKLADIGRGR